MKKCDVYMIRSMGWSRLVVAINVTGGDLRKPGRMNARMPGVHLFRGVTDRSKDLTKIDSYGKIEGPLKFWGNRAVKVGTVSSDTSVDLWLAKSRRGNKFGWKMSN